MWPMSGIKKYDPEKGVPWLHYYIEETTQIADFETEQQTKITHTSSSKETLIDLCRAMNWPCLQVGNPVSGWYTHEIKRRYF